MNQAVRQLLLVLGYVALVLGVDTLAYLDAGWPFAWRLFDWKLGSDFDLFKSVFWLLLPLAFCWRSLDRGWFGFGRWQRVDVALLAVLAGAGALALLLIPLFPELAAAYPGLSGQPAAAQRDFAADMLLWNLSWLPGWEFLLRYLLLRAAVAALPRGGWWLVPLAEGLYHLQKPLLEAAGAVLFSIVLTRWALARQNGLLPLVAHTLLELELILLLLLL